MLQFLQAQSADTTVLVDIQDSISYIKSGGVKQVDLVDYVVKWFKIENSPERRNDRKIRFSLFPSTSSASGGKTTFTSFNIAFLLGDISNTNVSNIYFYPYVAFGGQYGFQLMPNIWLRKNNWNFTGEYFILNYPQYTWGLGGNSPEGNKTLVDYKHLRVHQNALKSIVPHVYAGLGYALDKHYDIAVEETEFSNDVIGNYLQADKTTSTSSGITVPLLFDSRRNSGNPQQGLMASFTYSFFDTMIGSDNNWQSLFFDVRKYFPFSGKRYQILAFRSYYWTIVSGKVPYLDLPANRWEPINGSSSRGIRQNRYRSNAILYFESEYRFGISPNGLFGGVVFASVTGPSQYNTQQFLYWHPAGGAGIRLKFNKYSNTNISFDFAFSNEFASVYLFIGEAF
jgi:hypothetical protein